MNEPPSEDEDRKSVIRRWKAGDDGIVLCPPIGTDDYKNGNNKVIKNLPEQIW